MNRIHNGLHLSIRGLSKRIFFGLFLMVVQITSSWAGGVKLENVSFSSLPGDKIQLQLDLNGPSPEPKVFHTDNPARIAIDLPGVESALETKVFPVNNGAVNTVYAIESAGRVRVVVNLLKSVPYETKRVGNQVLVSISSAKEEVPESTGIVAPSRESLTNVSALIPEQSITDLDFRRGPNGEGRLLVALANPNTVVDTSEKGGKVIINFLNTKLPQTLSKRMDVLDFATPVQYVDAEMVGTKTTIKVTLTSADYDYSSFQTDGLLTVEFRPLTATEKEDEQKKKFPYVGERLSLNFQDIEVRSVLQILADFTDLNIIAADSVGGSVTLRLNDVPWDQALDLILKSKGLAKRESGNVIMVAPTAEINKIEKEELAAKKVIEQLEPLKTEYIQVNYAKAENFRNLLYGAASTGRNVNGCSITSGSRGGSSGGGGRGTTGAALGSRAGASGGRGGTGLADDVYTLLSRRGTAIVDSRTNTLIVRDTAKQLEEIRKILQLLDIPVRQVMIESRIVIADNTFAKEMGVRFGVVKGEQIGGSNFAVAGQTEGNIEDGSIEVTDTLVDLGAAVGAGSGGSLAMTLVKAADYVLNLELSALQDEGRGEVLANPRVMTSDRCEAVIKQGTQIPYQSGDIQNRTVTLVDAVLELKVTPQITPNGSVIMDLDIKKDSPGPTLGFGDVPIDTREVQASVQVENGETVVLGGIYEQTLNNTLNKVPFFADIPGVGFLFKKTVHQDNRKELLFFVTPKIIKEMGR
ncbi:MAG: type IV pilus secretin PilQ [Gammaproteobacteria bacterium]